MRRVASARVTAPQHIAQNYFEKACVELELTKLLDHEVKNLSGGELQVRAAPPRRAR